MFGTKKIEVILSTDHLTQKDVEAASTGRVDEWRLEAELDRLCALNDSLLPEWERLLAKVA